MFSNNHTMLFALGVSREIQVEAFGNPSVALEFKPSFCKQLTPFLPSGWHLDRANLPKCGSVVQSENGNAVVCDDLGTIIQAGPYHALFVRLPSALVVGEEDVKAGLKDLLETILSKYSQLNTAGAMYVTIHETALFLPHIVAHLNSLGFAYHHFSASFPRTDIGSRNEHIYYKWCRAGSKDMVPAYATSIEGAAAIVLSPDESSVLLVKEYGRFGMPGGAIDPGEGALEALRRELMEEVSVTLDDAFPPLLLGGYRKSRWRDAAVNDKRRPRALPRPHRRPGRARRRALAPRRRPASRLDRRARRRRRRKRAAAERGAGGLCGAGGGRRARRFLRADADLPGGARRGRGPGV